jgi:hypothetical protein
VKVKYSDKLALLELVHTQGVTLDGEKAVIIGVKEDFATVAILPNGYGFQWSWEAVKRIVEEKDGKFTSR